MKIEQKSDPFLCRKFNRKRSNTISALKRKNLNLIKMVEAYKSSVELDQDKETHLTRLTKDASRCANFSLYGNDNATSDITYFASVMCGNKVCFVCNYARQKRVRRKYFRWFKDNKTLYEIGKGKSRRYCTRSRFATHFAPRGYQVISEQPYDIMHLTLTVPHYSGTGFNGERYYYEILAGIFHNMRNEAKGWNELVYGGEYGIETTQNENGLNIHIHSILFVKQCTQNRNRVHRLILKEWNRRTVNRDNPREAFTETAIDSILKSNRTINRNYVKDLNPKGTTMINLEMIYSYDQGIKVRTTDFNSQEMLRAVMEAIKYHFEPLAFDKENKTFDLDLMAEIMPVIYKKQLYKKFGCLHGEKSLNLKEDDTLREDFEESAGLIDEETGELYPEYSFFVANPAFVYHDPKDNNKIYMSKEGKRRLKKINAFTVIAAVSQLGNMVKAQYHNKTKN
ncbi:MAG: hypothetical protein NTX61_08335 [Bacteroidetes bacterium]|nr:hypothetical protein [Bacteroidota bacterium]